MSKNQAGRAADAGESAGGKDGLLDRWVRDHPVWTFWFAAGAATAMFLAVYAIVGAPLIKVGFPLNDAVTSYVGALATTVVALAGALVSVMLARLALKLGYKAKAAADQANEIQEQMRKFEDPLYKEIRDGHKAAASLDLLGTLLREYSRELFGASQDERPIEATRFTYKRANDLMAEPSFYLYCSQLLDASRAAVQFSALQSLIYDANRGLAKEDGIRSARGAEAVAVEIAKLSRAIEGAKEEVLEDENHRLHVLAHELEWQHPANSLSGCESAARKDFPELAIGRDANALPWDDLLKPGARSVVHVLETDLAAFCEALGNVDRVDRRSLIVHETLRRFAGWQERSDDDVDVVIARWNDVICNRPEVLEREEQEQYARSGQLPDVSPVESESLWTKAIFLARNPAYDRAISTALEDTRFLNSLRVTPFDDELQLQLHHVTDESDSANFEEVMLRARKTARLLDIVHGAVERLREHVVGGTVVLPPFDPFHEISRPGSDNRSLIIVRPCFSRIELRYSSGQEDEDAWLADRTREYRHFDWTS